MEKIKTPNLIAEIVDIKEHDHLLRLEFSGVVSLLDADFSVIQVYTEGDMLCREFKGYTTIFKEEGNIVTLSNDGSVYVEHENAVPGEIEEYTPHEPTASELANGQIQMLKLAIKETDYKIIKCSEYQLLGLDMPYDVAELHSERQNIRDAINELEQLLEA